jgi:single-strand DNA-binding protein
MPNLSKITIIGHVGKDPAFPSEKYPNFVTFPVAVTEKWTDKATGNPTERTDWYNCTTSRESLSNVIKTYIHKGDAVMIIGKPKFDTYTTKEGEVKPKVEINIAELIMLGNKTDKQEQDANDNQPKGKSSAAIPDIGYMPSKSSTRSMKDSLDDEIPF